MLGRDQYLDDDELVRLIRAARERRHVNGRRDHALLCVLANLGIRPGEAVQLTAQDLNLAGDRPWLRIRRLKKRAALGAIDDLPLSLKLARVLRVYVRGAGLEDAARVFPLTVRQAERIFHYYVRRANLARQFKLYALRHTAATRALNETGDIRSVQVMLGHARITTTQIYAHVSIERRQALAEKIGGVV
jgi:site-specific recombinase XerD